MQDDYIKVAAEKYGSAFLKNLAVPLSVGVGVFVIGKFIDEMFDYFKEMNIKGKSKTYFQKMMEATPELQQEDPATVAKYWASLYHFSPFTAQDPLAAGAYIRQSIARGDTFGGPPIDTYKTLSEVSKNINDAKSRTKPGLGFADVGKGTSSSYLTAVLTDKDR